MIDRALKIVALLLLIFLIVALLCSCSVPNWNSTTYANESHDGRLMIVYNDGYATIYVDTLTGVQYFTRDRAGSCVVVNEDGSPMLWPAFDARENRT